ncbi:sugar kinase [Shewanella waksmanii]|uniref:sugar kinase n=1 Tax=Shewanella waksmanii TaxID=213783 RepID=UPI00048FF154|nr:sugar kinase [Shewanella waksmanii]
MTQIVFFGECMLEGEPCGLFSYGGDTLNSAVYLRRVSANNINVAYATALGTDDDSQRLLNAWCHEGLDTQLVTRLSDKKPGRYQIQLDTHGERQFSYQRADSAATAYFNEADTPLEQCLRSGQIDYLYLSGISLAILNDLAKNRLLSCIADFKQQGGKLVFDNNYRPVLWQHSHVRHYYHQIMQLTDIALLTDQDEYLLYGEQNLAQIIARTQAMQIPEVVIKQGGEPCVVITANGQETIATDKMSDVVDTCAAGDAFAAGYLSQRLKQLPVQQAAQFAHRLAGRVIQYPGAIIPSAAMQDLMTVNS